MHAHDAHVHHEGGYFLYFSIDASVDNGSLGCLVNDDSNPNVKVKVISISRIPNLCLFVLQDIQPGEITYDYGGYDLPWRRGMVSVVLSGFIVYTVLCIYCIVDTVRL